MWGVCTDIQREQAFKQADYFRHGIERCYIFYYSVEYSPGCYQTFYCTEEVEKRKK